MSYYHPATRSPLPQTTMGCVDADAAAEVGDASERGRRQHCVGAHRYLSRFGWGCGKPHGNSSPGECQSAQCHHFPGFCKQHSTGNAMERAVKRLGIIGPAYCLAKRMRSDKFYSRFLTGLKSVLKAKLVWIKASEQPEWRPKMTGVDSAREILELSYFRRDVRGEASGDDAIHGVGGDVEAKACRRRRLGELFLEEFPGDWRSPDVVFWDRATTDRQECNSREETPIPSIPPLPLPNCARTFAYRSPLPLLLGRRRWSTSSNS